MKTVFDTFSATTGWTASTGASIEALNTHSGYIAGGQAASLLLGFDGLNSYCEKTYTPISTTGYTDIVIWVWSRNKKNQQYTKSTDFSYSISFGTGKEFYLPAFDTFFCFTIACSKVATIDKIRITALTADEDYLILSYGLLCVDEIPLDIFVGVQEKIQADITENYLTSYPVGTITGSTGDTSITFGAAVPWMDKYAVIRITDGTHTEYHTIVSRDNLTFTFGGGYSGPSLLYDYSSASVYIFIPVVFGRRQIEIELPSITIWGMEPEHQPLGHELDNILDTFKTDNTFQERREGHFQKYGLLIDCEAREDELLAAGSRIIRDMIGRKYIWVNGRKVDIMFSGQAREIKPTDAFQIIPKVQYIADVIIKEELWKRTELPMTTETNITLTVV